jgi:hypothetical protein
MADDGYGQLAPGEELIERVVLNETPQGRVLAAAFIGVFGEFVASDVRPALRELADQGTEPQLLVNGLAQLLRTTADAIEFPLAHPRAGTPESAEA